MWSWRLGRKQLKPWGTGSQQDFFSSLGASLCAGQGSQGSPEDVPGPQAVEGRLSSYTGLCDQSLGSPSVNVSYRHSGVVTVRRHSFGFWSGSGLVLGISLQTHRGLPTASQARVYDDANSCSSFSSHSDLTSSGKALPDHLGTRWGSLSCTTAAAFTLNHDCWLLICLEHHCIPYVWQCA